MICREISSVAYSRLVVTVFIANVFVNGLPLAGRSQYVRYVERSFELFFTVYFLAEVNMQPKGLTNVNANCFINTAL
jgi:hypothetical protein